MVPIHHALAVLVFAAAAAAGGCGLVEFDVVEAIPPQTVQGSPLGALLPAALFSIPTQIDLQSETAARGTGPARSARLASLTLTVTDPAGATFEFLDSVVITVSGPGLEEREVARLDDVPPAARISIPPTPGVDLLPYVNAGATLRATATGRLPTETVTYTGQVVVRVKV